MNIFVDFEATQPAGEIIAIGAKAENGEQFFEYVKPQFSIVTSEITKLTGITQELLEQKGQFFDDIMKKFNKWCNSLCIGRIYQHFYSYGAADKQFLINSFQSLNSDDAINLVSYMITTMQDYSKNVALFFNGSTSLIKAYNYFENEKEQKHNALEDAEMLAKVFDKVQFNTPLDKYPFAKEERENYNWPSGTFFCKGTGKNATEHRFNDSYMAVEWLIRNKIGVKKSAEVHRDRIATNIMKAIRRNSTYMGYNWRRVKNV